LWRIALYNAPFKRKLSSIIWKSFANVLYQRRTCWFTLFSFFGFAFFSKVFFVIFKNYLKLFVEFVRLCFPQFYFVFYVEGFGFLKTFFRIFTMILWGLSDLLNLSQGGPLALFIEDFLYFWPFRPIFGHCSRQNSLSNLKIYVVLSTIVWDVHHGWAQSKKIFRSRNPQLRPALTYKHWQNPQINFKKIILREYPCEFISLLCLCGTFASDAEDSSIRQTTYLFISLLKRQFLDINLSPLNLSSILDEHNKNVRLLNNLDLKTK